MGQRRRTAMRARRFHLAMAKPNGYHHYSVEVTFSQQTPEEIPSPALT